MSDITGPKGYVILMFAQIVPFETVELYKERFQLWVISSSKHHLRG